MNGGAYGAGKAGTAFNLGQFIKRPQVLLRLVCWLYSVIVLGCIVSKGYVRETCAYNQENAACNFGISVSVIASKASIIFIILDAMFNNFSSIKTRRHVVMADMGFSAFWSFLWFACFCNLTDQWRKTNFLSPLEMSYVANDLRAAIIFSFFSIFAWAGLCYFAVQRFRQGADSAFAPSYEADPHMMPGGASYSGYPGGTETEEGYQAPPFASNEKAPGPNFQTPAY